MRILNITIVFVLIFITKSFPQLSINKKIYLGANKSFSCYSMFSTNDSGFVMAGINQIYFTNDTAFKVLIKYDKQGDFLWCNKYPDTNLIESVSGIFENSNHDFLISSRINSFGPPTTSIVHKIDENGNSLWRGRIIADGNYCEGANSIESGNNIYTNGSAEFSGLGFLSYLIKLDPNGNLIWKKIFSPDQMFLRNRTLNETNDGNLILSGVYPDTLNGYMCLAKADTAGHFYWFKSYAIGNLLLRSGSLIELSNNNFLIMCADTKNGIYLFKTDSSGNLLWTKKYFSRPYSMPFEEPKIIQVNDNDFLITKSVADSTTKGSLLLRVDSTGNIISSNLFGQNPFRDRYSQAAKFGDNKIATSVYEFSGNQMDNYTNLILMNDNSAPGTLCNVIPFQMNDSICNFTEALVNVNYYNNSVLNYLRQTVNTFPDTIIDSVLCVTTSLNENDINQHVIIKPNPFNSICSISAPDLSNAELSLFDITGRQLLLRTFEKEITLDLSYFKNGIYLVHIMDKNGIGITEKIVKY